jgi:hypothetical protein
MMQMQYFHCMMQMQYFHCMDMVNGEHSGVWTSPDPYHCTPKIWSWLAKRISSYGAEHKNQDGHLAAIIRSRTATNIDRAPPLTHTITPLKYEVD